MMGWLRRWIGRLLCAVLALVTLGPFSDSARAAELAPHRGTYQLSLWQSRLEAPLAEVSGVMTLSLAAGCEAWTLRQDLDLRAVAENGQVVALRILGEWAESLDGKRMTFSHRVERDGAVLRDVAGGGVIFDQQRGGAATFSRPSNRDVRLRRGTLFPISATRHLVDVIGRGVSNHQFFLFDGGSDSGSYTAVHVLAGHPVALSVAPVGDLELINTPAWRARTSLFTPNSLPSDPPVNETETQTHSNGVVNRMVLSLGALTVLAELREIEALPPGRC